MKFTSDIVIGLEVHAELKTNSKLFCSCSRTGSDAPNTRTCPTCLGHPGSKPVLNAKAVEYAVKLALAVGAKIDSRLIFSRKSYFYPDMSKNYQISQYERPLAVAGNISLSDGKDIGLVRIHLEEDPASLVHPNGMEKSGYVLVDYNRSGNPLVEIVTEPQMQSPGQARDFMKQLISILKYLGIFDDSCIIKADANVSVKPKYIRTEIKNINGFKEIERALRYEVERQKKVIAEGRQLVQATRAWDPAKGLTRLMRTKETEEDYGYIIEPDLIVTDISEEMVSGIREGLPELARDRSARFVQEYGIGRADAGVLTAQLELAEMYEKVAAEIDPILAARWLRRELARVMNYNSLDFADIRIDEGHMIALLSMVEKKEITEAVAQKILEKLIVEPFDVREHVKKNSLAAVSDSGALEKVAKEAIAENPKAVGEYKSGQAKALNFLMGQVMKKTKGTAEPKEVKRILEGLI